MSNKLAKMRIPATRQLRSIGRNVTPFRIAPRESAFTLFEVMIALGVFVIAVTGLAMALETSIQAALDARQRSLARMQLESRLAIAMADPPANGRRVIEARDNNGIRVEETFVPYEVKSTNGTIVPGLWKLKVVADSGDRNAKGQETAEILIYKP